MRNTRIYSAPSLSEVIKYLLLYRLTGTLTIRRARSFRQEEAILIIEYGYPTRISWGVIEEGTIEPILRLLNSWGEIHFTFLQAAAPLLQLPAPQLLQQEQFYPPRPPAQQYPSVTRPLPAMPSLTAPILAISAQSSAARTTPQDTSGSSGQNSRPSQAMREMGLHLTKNSEVAIPLLTTHAKNYPFTNLPRHDRTIFLLINGRRTVSDLIQLTKRTLEDVYDSLYRLRDLELIAV